MSDLERIEKKIDELRGDFLPKTTVIAMFRVAFRDGHSPSDRPCVTCRTITAFLGQPHGCYEYQQQKQQKRVQCPECGGVGHTASTCSNGG